MHSEPIHALLQNPKLLLRSSCRLLPCMEMPAFSRPALGSTCWCHSGIPAGDRGEPGQQRGKRPATQSPLVARGLAIAQAWSEATHLAEGAPIYRNSHLPSLHGEVEPRARQRVLQVAGEGLLDSFGIIWLLRICPELQSSDKLFRTGCTYCCLALEPQKLE